MIAAPVPDVVCLGLLVADAIARPVDELPPPGTLAFVDRVELHAGGCALNTATVLARLGLEVALVGKVGHDSLGEFLLARADEHGLDRSGVVVDPGTATAATAVLVDGSGERTFLHSPGANARLRPADLDPELLFSGRALHVGGALLLPGMLEGPTAAMLAEARRRRIVTSLDTVWDPSGRWTRILPSLPHLDLFTPSLAEARAVSGLELAEEITAWLRGRGVGIAAVTLGERGSYVAGPGFADEVPPADVEPLDETGSGDAFAGALLYAVLAGMQLEEAARFANAVGALATTAVGATDGVPELDESLRAAGLG